MNVCIIGMLWQGQLLEGTACFLVGCNTHDDNSGRQIRCAKNVSALLFSIVVWSSSYAPHSHLFSCPVFELFSNYAFDLISILFQIKTLNDLCV